MTPSELEDLKEKVDAARIDMDDSMAELSRVIDVIEMNRAYLSEVAERLSSKSKFEDDRIPGYPQEKLAIISQSLYTVIRMMDTEMSSMLDYQRDAEIENPVKED